MGAHTKRGAKIIIGARSAIFAPIKNLGLIVIDEEHETSYKSETQPRYDAVEVAEQLCSMSDSILVLGSATPTISRYYMCRKANMNYWNCLIECNALCQIPLL